MTYIDLSILNVIPKYIIEDKSPRNGIIIPEGLSLKSLNNELN